MKPLRYFFVAVAVFVVGYAPPATAEVYLNKQWDTTFNRFMVKSLDLIGESLTLDCEYQNAYGDSMGLSPGPPFYIEGAITIDNVYGANYNVVKWGGLTIDAQFACGQPFTVIVVNPDANIIVNGNLLIEGSTSNPVIFQGYFNFYSQYTGGDDTSYVNSYNIIFENCVFGSPNYSGLLIGNPFRFTGGNITFDGCTFNDISGDFPMFIEYFDNAYQYRLPYWHFTMRNCDLTNAHFDLLPPIAPMEVYHAKEVTLVHNHFSNIPFNAAPTRGVVTLAGCGLQSIKQNTVTNTSLNAFVFNGCFVDTNAVLQSSNELPFIVDNLNITESGSLAIGEGSVLKILYSNPNNNVTVSGRLTANKTVFTSWRDDTYGGNTDLGDTGSPLYWSRGIRVTPSGTINLTNCKVFYSEDGVIVEGDAYIDSCLFEHNRNALSLCGFNGNAFQVSNSNFRDNVFDGLSANCDSGNIQNLSMTNVVSQANGVDGFSIANTSDHEANVTLDNCQFAGNGRFGLYLACSGPGHISIVNSVISANASDGIRANDFGADNINFVIANNVIVGNGSSVAHNAVDIQTGNVNFINNTVGYSYGMGLKYYPSVTGSNDVANNIFFNNGNYGVFKYTETIPLFAKNDFWNDMGSKGELFFWTSTGGLYSVADVATLGGEYASNLHLDPMFTPEIIDSISQFSYDSISNTSVIIVDDSIFQDCHLGHTIIQPDTSEYPWFYILRNAGDSLFILGDIGSIADTGDVYRIFNYHLLDISTLVDAGRNASAVGFYDIDREDRVIDGDSNHVATIDIGADEYNPNSGYESPIRITYPTAGEFFGEGDTCEIRWETDSVAHVHILSSATDDPDLIWWDTVARNVDAATGEYAWAVPEDVSAKYLIRLEDATDSSIHAQAGPFTIKPWILVRKEADSSLIPFFPEVDGWRFPNDKAHMWPATWFAQFDYAHVNDPFTGQPYPFAFYNPLIVNAQPKDFPDWPSFVRAFGVDQCYENAGGQLYYHLAALMCWRDIKDDWGGSCFGFGASSPLAFFDSTDFHAAHPGVGAFAGLHELDTSGYTRNMITEYYTQQYGDEHQACMKANEPDSPRETLAKLKEVMGRNYVNGPMLAIGNNGPNGGGHVINPYLLKADTATPGRYLVFIYDCNHPAPDVPNRRDTLYIDSAANTWSYSDFPNWPGPLGFCHMMDSSASYLRLPTLSLPAPHRPTLRIAYIANDSLNVLFNGVTDIVIEDHSGRRIGFRGDTVWSAIAGAFTHVRINGFPSRPYGYLLPSDTYKCEIGTTDDTAMTFSIWDSTTNYHYARGGADPSQTDEITYDTGLSVANDDPATKRCRLSCLYMGADEDRLCALEGVTLNSGERLDLTTAGGATFSLRDYSTGQTIDFEFWIVGPSGSKWVKTETVSLPAGALGTVAPEWDEINLGQIKWLLDNDADGNYDDSTTLNIVTGVEDDPRGSILPYRFDLSQNYPNPFNPVTTIEYSLPERSHVTIDVFNVLGQLVRTLVDREESAGSYAVTWDGKGSSGIPVATGVYLYRFQAGDHIETKIMLLLK
jgi:hypothetical protein